MANFKLVLVAILVEWAAIIIAEDAQPSQAESEKLVLKDIFRESKVLQENSTTKIVPLRYITCEGVTWSCEDCNTKRFCAEFWWNTVVTYIQCPIWAPYCNSSASTAWCTDTGSAGCTGAK